MKQYNVVAMGGTFDVIHNGHIALLDKAFSISSRVIIGLTGDELVKRKGKEILHTYEQRLGRLRSLLDDRFPGRQHVISRLENDFGPAAIEGDVEALVVSEETADKGRILNELRREHNMREVDVILVPMVLAEDGKRISSTRIRDSEIDAEGNLT